VAFAPLRNDHEAVGGNGRHHADFAKRGQRLRDMVRGAPNLDEAITVALTAADCLMVNRNAGSGTRILTDRLLNGARPAGYWSQPKSHNAVAVAVAQNRADWGMAIESAARQYGLGFIPAQDEHYDFAIPKSRWDSPAVQHFRKALADISVREALRAMGFRL
jgi:putative molybdopterin biosynthesis protein